MSFNVFPYRYSTVMYENNDGKDNFVLKKVRIPFKLYK